MTSSGCHDANVPDAARGLLVDLGATGNDGLVDTRMTLRRLAPPVRLIGSLL